MFNKSNLIILFLTVNLAISLKSTDFCIIKQQECKGFYDYHQNYQIKCELIKCHGKTSYDCGLHLCSRNKSECNEYKYMKFYEKIYKYEGKTFNLDLTEKLTKLINDLQLFEKRVSICPNKAYEFNSNDFCLNGLNCIEKRKDRRFLEIGNIYGSSITVRKIDCKCPANQSFKCGKNCVAHSFACSYFKSMNGKVLNKSTIRNCGNGNVTRTIW